jgi:sulfate adenylyltransferase (ADP) / ATP adenylyltransferase
VAPLSLSDADAMVCSVREMNGLGFFNAGAIAGASQPRKHLQILPIEATDIPVNEAALGALREGKTTIPQFRGFRHALVAVSPESTPSELLEAYRTRVDVDVPHNLLLTTRWMMVVPRSSGEWEGISLNSVGFAGFLLVKGAAKDALDRVGPLKVLNSVCEPV